MLWLRTSGRPRRSSGGRPRPPCSRGSGPRRWCPEPRERIAAIVRAKAAAPPSARSSRATAVTTAWARPIVATASATCSGSVSFEGQGVARVHEAETARSRAPLPVDHERRRAVRPALGEVRAAGLLAHGDEPEASDHATGAAALRLRSSRAQARSQGLRSPEGDPAAGSTPAAGAAAPGRGPRAGRCRAWSGPAGAAGRCQVRPLAAAARRWRGCRRGDGQDRTGRRRQAASWTSSTRRRRPPKAKAPAAARSTASTTRRIETDALGGHRRDGLVGDPARDDVRRTSTDRGRR